MLDNAPSNLMIGLGDAGPTFADVLEMLDIIELTPTRRRDLASALRRIGSLADRPLEHIPADTRVLAEILGEIDRNGSGLAAQTRRNLASNALGALRECGIIPPQDPPLEGVWAEFHDSLPSERLSIGLSRFCRHAAARGIELSDISDRTIDDFCAWVAASTSLDDEQIRDLHRKVPRLWNEAAEALPERELPELTVPDHRKPPANPSLEQYPETFQDDVARHCAWLAGASFLEDPVPRKLKPTTVELRQKHIRYAGGALIESGVPISEIADLTVLTRPENVRAIAKVYYGRNDEEVTTFLRDLVSALVSIARHWVEVDAETLEQLRKIRRALGTNPTGLTEKNRELIHRFDDRALRARLYDLPDLLFGKARKLGGPRGAMRAQIGLAIAILTAVPLRGQNLARLDVGRSLVRQGRTWRVHLAPGEVKNDQPLDFLLPEEVGALLETYLETFRGHLPGRAGFIFPGATGTAPKGTATLAGQISDAIERHLGIHMTPHQFRHLAAKLYLDHHPGDYVTVQRFLGHKNLKTTMAYYAEFRTEQAGQAYAEMLEADRLAAAAQRRRKRRK